MWGEFKKNDSGWDIFFLIFLAFICETTICSLLKRFDNIVLPDADFFFQIILGIDLFFMAKRQ